MLATRSPLSVLRDQLSTLAASLPGVREGSDAAVHDARVATRRIRETLEIAGSELDRNDLAAVSDTMRDAGRALGRARDRDVMLELLQSLDIALPAAGPVIGRLRYDAARARLRARRRLIKDLEAIDLPAVPERLRRVLRPHPLQLRFGRPAWRDELREHIAARAGEAARALEYASGVYFPNRAHAARLAIKKLRYALELADATGVWKVPRAVRRLRKAQDVLGRAHDREVLLDRTAALAAGDAALDRGALSTLTAFLESETLALHRRYLAMRPELRAVCDMCERCGRRRGLAPALLTAGAAIPALMLLRRRRAARAAGAESESDDVRVRVTVS